MSAERAICRIDDLANPGSRAFTMGTGDWPLRGFVVRRGDCIAAYLNRCPHAGHPLNWQPDRFLTMDAERILCSSHGAQFEIESGLCVLGPCVGRGLEPIATTIADGYLLLEDDPDEIAKRFAYR